MAIGHNAFLTGARFHYRDWFPGGNIDKSFCPIGRQYACRDSVIARVFITKIVD